ncbi:MAG TPA: GPR1/FUN34/YaaH family transporter [Segeticoccus sp.]|uniref:acetate uptake transporter family protein n=1 Tax=Segeticoccus sp. TaxID=2706531 RepID=UPI002D7EC442|nr:GPR1/FUN34/YaaH family transporter [Segeticoccus sp.]HET8599124.1 GPR1/FUN34/YaaH family transporter [Segeticoccus sp.]
MPILGRHHRRHAPTTDEARRMHPREHAGNGPATAAPTAAAPTAATPEAPITPNGPAPTTAPAAASDAGPTTAPTAASNAGPTTAPPAGPGPTEWRGAGTPATATGDPATVNPATRDPYMHHDGDRPFEMWEGRSRIVLMPTAPPSILGLLGFMGATVMVGAWFAGWYGTPATPLIIFPFAMVFGGFAQFAAGMFAYRARDGVATAMHGLWGSFWIAFGIMQLLVLGGLMPAIPKGAVNPSFAWWFIVLCVITGMGALASLAENLGMFTVLGLLAVASGFTAAAFWGGFSVSLTIAGYLFVASAAAALYTASAMMFKNTYGRVILPLGEWGGAHKNIPGRIPSMPIQYEGGMPGAKIGQ